MTRTAPSPRARLRALAATALLRRARRRRLLGRAPARSPAGARRRPLRQPPATAAAGRTAAGGKVVGYFTNWGVYDRNYHVKNIETSGSADKLTHINYAFGNVQGGKCTIGDTYADYEKAYTADQSRRRRRPTPGTRPLRGNFNQLRKLKKKHPDLKVLWSFGGWTWSGGFTEAAKNPAAFAESCYDLVEDSTLGRCLRRHRHRLGVPQRLRSDL